ncbi:MAG: hypothetical protein AAFP90_01995 [Planctomycetota bacterium]
MTHRYHSGDWVVYKKAKRSPHPGPRAELVRPSTKGEAYGYVVRKYWIVDSVLPDGRVEVCTKTGKRHVLEADDPNLDKADFVSRFLYRRRYIAVEKRLERTRSDQTDQATQPDLMAENDTSENNVEQGSGVS